MLQTIKQIINSVGLTGWIIIGVVVAALIIYKILKNYYSEGYTYDDYIPPLPAEDIAWLHK